MPEIQNYAQISHEYPTTLAKARETIWSLAGRYPDKLANLKHLAASIDEEIRSFWADFIPEESEDA